MANWQGMILTAKGKALQAKVEAGATKLVLTKIKLGDGKISKSQSLEGLDDLVSPKQIIGITTIIPRSDGICKLTGTVTNFDLTAGYYLQELGVFATDPDDGEILYAITTDSTPDYLQENGGMAIVSQEFNISIAIGNKSQVTATIDAAGLLTVGSVTVLIKQLILNHNTDPKAHAAGIAGNAATASDITAGFSDNSLAFPINNFRTTIFGSSNGGTHAKPFRVIDVSGTAHGSGFAWGMGDTHGFIHTQYNDGKVFVGGGAANVINWYKQLATIDGTIANADTVDGKHASAFAPSGFGLGIQKNLFENANLILNTGLYYCTTGLPSGVSDANVYHHAHSDAYAHQMAFEFGTNYDNTIYSRIKNNGTWSAWRQIATTDIVLPLTGGTLAGPLIANGGVKGNLTGNAATASDITSGFMNDSLAFPISNFRTTMFGSSAQGVHTKPFRVRDVIGNAYGSGLAWGVGDTHGFIHTQYNDGKTFIGGGSGDVIAWYKQLATTDAVLPLSGGTLTGDLRIPQSYNTGWYRSIGDGGWYSETYGGGWYMSDATWIRAYNDKNVYTKGVFQADGGFNGWLHGTADNSNTVGGASLSQLTRADVSQNMSEGISHRYLKKGGYMLVGGIRTDGGDVSCVTTDGTNLVMDSRNAGDIYLGYFGGKNVNFCGGSNTIKSHVDADGVFQGTASYANTAGNANAVNGHVFNWSGQAGQPTWLWGGDDASNMYVYNPSNFNVNYANNAGAVNGWTASALARQLSGRNSPVITPLINWAAMAATAGVANVRNLGNAGSGIYAYGGDNGALHNGDIWLTQSYRNFDAILVAACNDGADYSIWVKWESWELEVAFSQAYRFDLLKGNRICYWTVWCAGQGTVSHPVSSTTGFACQEQNGGIIEIYGLNY